MTPLAPVSHAVEVEASVQLRAVPSSCFRLSDRESPPLRALCRPTSELGRLLPGRSAGNEGRGDVYPTRDCIMRMKSKEY